MFEGAAQLSVTTPSPGVPTNAVGAVGGLAGVADAALDQVPIPSELTAATWKV